MITVNINFSETPAEELLISKEYLSPKWKLEIPKVSVFDIETLEDPVNGVFEHRLVSIAFSSEIDKQSKYWVIENSSETARQKIGIYFTADQTKRLKLMNSWIIYSNLVK